MSERFRGHGPKFEEALRAIERSIVSAPLERLGPCGLQTQLGKFLGRTGTRVEPLDCPPCRATATAVGWRSPI